MTMPKGTPTPQQAQSPLQRWRLERCEVSAHDMAAALGVAPQTYSLYEKGNEPYPPAFLKKLEEFGLDGKEVERQRKDFCLARLEELRRQIKARLGVEG